MRLGHVAVLVCDLDEMVAFYTDVVGLQISEIGTGAGRSDAPASRSCRGTRRHFTISSHSWKFGRIALGRRT
jgi:hypothetical protein